MNSIYGNPCYYDLAFSYRDYQREVAVMAECSRRYARVPLGHVLEICCGHAPHLPAWHRLGVRYTGVDLNAGMLARARAQAQSLGASAAFVQEDLGAFMLPEPADFAYLLLGSLYARDTAHLEAHFDAVASALRPGGLYFMEWSVDFDPMADIVDAWDVERDGVRIEASYWTTCLNRIEQVYEDTMHLEVDDRGTRHSLEDRATRRRIFPQEFLAFIRHHPAFEFVGWWNDWDLDRPLDGTFPVNRPIIVIRGV